ncbi:hypothetical protein [Lentzea sp. NPDC060358]|uniref:hypothetical protein n=1 Tax=Lentzea sp. NPDC060358 TaxID=3347103 RepID=UPI003661A25E
MKLFVGGVGLAAALVTTISAPATAGTSEPETTTRAAVQTVGVAVDTLPEVGRSAVPVVCFRGHVEDIGWQGWDCDDDGSWAFAGTISQFRRLEALQVVAYGTGGGTCAQAHVQDYGWRPQVCVADGVVAQVGTTGEFRRIEAIGFGSSSLGSCAEAHVQDYAWMGYKCTGAGQVNVVGTTGEFRRMEAVTGTILQ